MFSIPVNVQVIAAVLFGIVVIINLLSLLCGKKKVVGVPMVRRYTAIGYKDVQQGERVRSLYYSNETGNRLMD